MPKKRIAILGSTGSIGTQTLDVIAQFPDLFEVVGLTTNSRLELLAEQCRRFRPSYAGACDAAFADGADKSDGAARTRIEAGGALFHAGTDALLKLVGEFDFDLLVVATAGAAGLAPALAALERGVNVALANKEVLVMAGELVMRLCRERNCRILPVDSEHNAVFQCLGEQSAAKVRRLILTASGGPFLNFSAEQLKHATVEQALEHPVWNMGPKVTIDSSTLLNKGLEVIEAHQLYGIPVEKIEVLIHPQSICHSMVEFIDGSILAQLGRPDMRLPIQNCLTWPERRENPLPSIDWTQLSSLTFEQPDRERFPCLELAYRAARAGGTLPAVLNAAGEVAVQRFLEREIEYLEIARIIASVIERHRTAPATTLAAVLDADRWARQEARRLARRALPA